MKKIIVPIDFSKYSENALKVAAFLSKKIDATIYALHMLDIQEVNLVESMSYRQEKSIFFLKVGEIKMKEFLKKDYLEGLEVIPIIKRYKIFTEVNVIAKEVGADLIIMGSHGVSGLEEFLLGSNTEKVIRYSDLPVLVIKKELGDANFKESVFATDFSKETIPAFKKMVKVLELIGTKLDILFVNLPNEDFKTSSQMRALATDFLMEAEGNTDRLTNVHFVSDRSVEMGILNFSELVGADLISVITHARKGLSHIFTGSVSEDISNHSTLPIMTFKI